MGRPYRSVFKQFNIVYIVKIFIEFEILKQYKIHFNFEQQFNLCIYLHCMQILDCNVTRCTANDEDR